MLRDSIRAIRFRFSPLRRQVNRLWDSAEEPVLACVLTTASPFSLSDIMQRVEMLITRTGGTIRYRCSLLSESTDHELSKERAREIEGWLRSLGAFQLGSAQEVIDGSITQIAVRDQRDRNCLTENSSDTPQAQLREGLLCLARSGSLPADPDTTI